jgi:hypothetical protein
LHPSGRQKADIWHLRRHPKVLNLPFAEHLGRAEKDNAIDVYSRMSARMFWVTMSGRISSPPSRTPDSGGKKGVSVSDYRVASAATHFSRLVTTLSGLVRAVFPNRAARRLGS